MTYSLVTLLKVREHNKATAEQKLREAHNRLESEEKKLVQIQTHLLKTIEGRTVLQDNFFIRAQNQPINQRDALLVALLSQKKVASELALKKSLYHQAQLVNEAQKIKHLATKSAMEAHRDLKIIDKHHAVWQRQSHKREELKNEYENDDQNGVRFGLRLKRG